MPSPKRVHRIVVAFGTRPEACKMAPVIYALREEDGLEPFVLVTGQHREQLDSMLELFDITPDADLNVMTERQTLPELFAKIVPAAAAILKDIKPSYVLVHGDTMTTFAVALAAFYEGIPVAHVEAGLRSFNMAEPFPEEANRCLTDVLANLYFAPTEWAKENLLKEGKDAANIFVTGNTAVDAVMYVKERAVLPDHIKKYDKLVAVTMHRRENLPVMHEMAQALVEVARKHPDFTFVYPVHLNPAVREAVWDVLEPVNNFILEEPWDYQQMVALLSSAQLIITDSGGIQEEGAALGVPVVVLRNTTERPEGVDAGILILAGNQADRITSVVGNLLSNKEQRDAMRQAKNPYGDGLAGQRVARVIQRNIIITKTSHPYNL